MVAWSIATVCIFSVFGQFKRGTSTLPPLLDEKIGEEPILGQIKENSAIPGNSKEW